MRALVTAALALLAAFPLTGCALPGSQATDGMPPASTPPSPGTPSAPGATGFVVDDLSAALSDGRQRPLREDDNVTLHYTLRNAAISGPPASFLVSFILAGEVRDVHPLTLAPGANRSFAHSFGSVRGVAAIDAQVRAGDQDARLHADVSPWPRVGEPVDLGPFLLTVTAFGPNGSSGRTDVSMTLSQRALPDGDPHQTRVRLLCVDTADRVSIVADALPDAPGPDNSTELTLSFRSCPGLTYGIEVTGLDAHWKGFSSRILFVPPGWSPTQA